MQKYALNTNFELRVNNSNAVMFCAAKNDLKELNVSK